MANKNGIEMAVPTKRKKPGYEHLSADEEYQRCERKSNQSASASKRVPSAVYEDYAPPIPKVVRPVDHIGEYDFSSYPLECLSTRLARPQSA